MVPEIQILSFTASHLVREKAEYRLVPEWLPEVLGEEDPSTSVWAGRTDGALPSGDRKGLYCCADMAVVSWDEGDWCGRTRRPRQGQMRK